MSGYRVEMSGIMKSFGGVEALRDVSFRVRPGEIHALVGENGAGKSTLMKVLSGAHQKDGGSIHIDGRAVHIANPRMGRKMGIGIIYQELVLAPDLTVAENIFLDHLGGKRGFIRWAKLYQGAAELIARLGFEVNPRALVRDLSVAYRQVVEIAKALSENTRILILDEPTAVLAPRETERLFDVLRKLKEEGVSIIYISHRLDEIFRIADTVTVLKDGEVTGSLDPKVASADDIIALMIGRRLSALFPEREFAIGEEVLRVSRLNRGAKVRGVSFSLRAGEVLGIAGLVGSGRTETVRAIFGANVRDSGSVVVEGRPAGFRNPAGAVRAGIGFVPEDRKEQGAILSFSVRKNVTLPSLRRFFSRFGLIREREEKRAALALADQLGIRAPDTETKVSDLSGGNQQKVVLAKWLGTQSKILILDEPTRGVDVGAKAEIYKLINDLAGEGLGILLISSELMEIIGICDRALVMCDGRIQGTLEKHELSEENIMNLAIANRAV